MKNSVSTHDNPFSRRETLVSERPYVKHVTKLLTTHTSWSNDKLE